MKGFNRKVARVTGSIVAAVLASAGAATVTNSSSAALPIPFSQKVVKISDAYQLAQCSLVINAHDFSGNNTGYITAQSQANLFGGLVSSSIIKCDAYNAANTLVDSYTYTGTSATMVNTRKNGSYGLSPTYKICITLTRSLYTGGTTTQSKCN
jgi:hypothetical protein